MDSAGMHINTAVNRMVAVNFIGLNLYAVPNCENYELCFGT